MNLSVTGILKDYKTFSREFWLSYKVLEKIMPVSKFEEIKLRLLKAKKIPSEVMDMVDESVFTREKELLDQEWKQKNEEAKATGTAIHEEIRNAINQNSSYLQTSFGIGGKIQGNTSLQGIQEGVLSELKIEVPLNDNYTLVGIPDLIQIEDGVVNIYDWKTDAEGIKFKSHYDVSKKSSKKLKFPLSSYDDANGILYQLQLSLYMWMILKLRPDLKPGMLKIVLLSGNKVRKTYEVNYLEKDINKLLQWHIKQLQVRSDIKKCKEINY